eukprot:scaffold154_cov129-Cylindrotheca_fusiformis.AAC.4
MVTSTRGTKKYSHQRSRSLSSPPLDVMKADSDQDKKSRPSSWMALQRINLRFQMLPKYLRVVFAIGGCLIVLSIITIAIHSFQPTDESLERLRHRPHFAEKPRVLGLRQTSDLDRGLSHVSLVVGFGELPEPGKRELIARYNPLPVQNKLLKSPDSMDKGECQPMYDWQSGHNPTCNVIHEATYGWERLLNERDDLSSVSSSDEKLWDSVEQSRLVAAGAFRQVWKIFEWDGKTKRALKTLRVDAKNKNFDLRSFDRHRRDAMAFEQLTSSPLIVDIYGFCTNSALFDWGDQGTLEDIYRHNPDISKEQLLQIAYNVSLSVAHAHNFDDRGRATLAHTDIKPDQFLVQDGYYKLTDFNRARFLLWNQRWNIPCGFQVGKNGGIWRSPEEYKYEAETEKVDVYSLGNVLYFLLTRTYPWNGYPAKEVYDAVMKGDRPGIPEVIQQSDHPFDRFMIQAIKMCYTHKKEERPGAFDVAAKLKEGIEQLTNK